jgi:hypothetical protein
MNSSLSFTSVLGSSYLEDLEGMMFFNPLQKKALAGINHSIKDFGMPAVEVEGDRLRVRVEGLPEAQSLFALDNRGEPPVLAGAMVFCRLDVENLVLVHIAVGRDYARGGKLGDEHLVSTFVAELRAIARRLRGVQNVILKYSGGLTIPVARAD